MISTEPHRPLLLGHRGARLCAPENSISAFELALRHGCDGFEFDLRRTRDAQVVCCHDPLFNKRSIARNRLEALHASVQEKKAATLLPLLREVIEKLAPRAFLDIELKVLGMEAAVAEAVKELAPSSFVVSSFFPETLAAMRRAAPRVRLGYICRKPRRLRAWKKIRCEVVIPHFILLTQELIDEVHADGRQIFVWTVNEQKQMLRSAEMGVDAIISDETELLGRTFRARRKLRHPAD